MYQFLYGVLYFLYCHRRNKSTISPKYMMLYAHASCRTPKYTIKASGRAALSQSSRRFSSFSFSKVLFFYIIALLDTFFIYILYGVSVLLIFLCMAPIPPTRKWESTNFEFAMQRLNPERYFFEVHFNIIDNGRKLVIPCIFFLRGTILFLIVLVSIQTSRAHV